MIVDKSQFTKDSMPTDGLAGSGEYSSQAADHESELALSTEHADQSETCSSNPTDSPVKASAVKFVSVLSEFLPSLSELNNAADIDEKIQEFASHFCSGTI